MGRRLLPCGCDGDPMWTIEQRVGRLIEIRVASPIVYADLEGFGARLGECITRLTERVPRVLACTDLSGAHIFAPEVAEWFIRLMHRDNPVLERNAFLIGQSAVFALQIERMLKQGNSLTRRAFREPEPLIEWLGELLSPLERERVRQLLAASSTRL